MGVAVPLLPRWVHGWGGGGGAVRGQLCSIGHRPCTPRAPLPTSPLALPPPHPPLALPPPHPPFALPPPHPPLALPPHPPVQVLGHSKTVLVLLGGWAFLGDTITPRKFGGMALAVAGMVW